MTQEYPFKVSVCVVTYNQEGLIEQCLNSLLAQQTDFSFEIVVADDCSTDGTPALIRALAARHPGRIRPILRSRNVGAYENMLMAHDAGTGQYIAHMDGDDYALPGKLQLQADYLDAHPECNIVFHRMQILNQASGLIVDDAIELGRFKHVSFDRGDFLRYITLGMNSAKMYRARMRDFPRPDFPVIDFFMNVEQVGDGRAGFAGSAPLGVYRCGIGIASSGNTTRKELQRSMLYFARKYPHYRLEISIAALVVFAAALKNAQWDNCRLYGAVLLRTLRPSTLWHVWEDRRIVPMLIIPKAVR